MVTGKIGNQTGNFVLDTGAPYLVLNETYFEDARQSNDEAAGVTGQVEIAKLHVDTLTIPGHHWKNLDADVTNLGNIEDSKGIKILGLLGIALFKEYELSINYFENQLYLNTLNEKGEVRDTSGIPAWKQLYKGKMQVKDDHLFTTVSIGKKRLTTCIDTGAEACVLNNDMPDYVWDLLEVKGRFLLTGVGNTQTEVLSAKLLELRLNKYRIKNVRLVVANLESLSEAYGKEVDFVLGYTLLAGYIVTFNFVKNSITLSSNV